MTVLLFLLLALPPRSASSGGETQNLVRLFEARYRPARTLQATFLEKYMENGRVTRSEAGVAYFRKPGKMRWEYDAPESNLFLVDGKSAWFYVPADHTVTRVPAKQSADWRTPLALLAGEAKVSRVCAKVALAASEKPEDPGDAVLRCTVRGAEESGAEPAADSARTQHSGNETAYFEIRRASGELVKVLIQEPGGVAVEFHFENWRFDAPVSDALFRFEPPAGVAIVNGELPEGGANSSLKP